MQAGARTYPEPPLPAQHLGKPGEEARWSSSPCTTLLTTRAQRSLRTKSRS
jgi:hypothetical protein